ncbi:MAG: redox-regulated ATPase YchF [Lentisphaerae bacterium]|jgi:GTP-binding protein YchF|nr:redox-regulated ATPase YchF [Lentisphaerota bacterium]
MGLSIGIVGLPNVGKSTLFNALTRAQNAASENYPFCTIEPNMALVPVPDERLSKLAQVTRPERMVNALVEFSDIAGLVRGASRGEGLGNKFLANIREADAILHVVRCFDDPDVVHVEGTVDPLRDVHIIENELLLADLESIERRMERVGKMARFDKDAQTKLEVLGELLKHVMDGNPVRTYPRHDSPELKIIFREMRFLTDKHTIFVANVGEDNVSEDNRETLALREYAASRGEECVRICAKIEEDMAGLPDAERTEFLSSYGIDKSGLDTIISAGYKALGMISFFTIGPREIHAWTIRRGCKAAKAAGVIHSDFERGFIRAEVIPYGEYIAHGGEQNCKSLGLARMEGRDYVISDGDVVKYLFNV